MPISYNVGTNTITVTGYTEIAPCTFNDLYNADKAGTLSLHARVGVAAVDGAPVAVDRAERPTDYVVLGGASNDLYFAVANWNLMTNATLRIVGTDRDGAAQQEDIVVNANGNYSATLWFATVTTTQITVFNTPGGGSFDYDLIQGQWGVVWKQDTQQYLFECLIVVGDNVNPAWFIDTQKLVTFAYPMAHNSTVIQVLTNANFYLGTVIDTASKTTKNGCTIYVRNTGALVGVVRLVFGGFVQTPDLRLRSCTFYSENMTNCQVVSWTAGTHIECWNCSFQASIWLDIADCDGTSSVYNYNSYGSANFGLSGTTGDDERIMVQGAGRSSLYLSFAVTMVGVVSLQSADLATVNGVVNFNLVDCVVDNWTFLWWLAGTVNRRYTFNMRVVDGAGTGIAGVTVAMVDVAGGAVFSVVTDALGDIAEQTITYGYYQLATGDNIQPVGTYSPHVVTLSKPGYATRTIVYTMDRPRGEVEKLGGAAPHGREYRRRRVPGEVSALDEYE